MKHFISVSRAGLEKNRSEGGGEPPIRVEGADGTLQFAHGVEIAGPSELVYRPELPRPQGVEVWLESEAPLILRSAQCQPRQPRLGETSSLRRLLDSPLPEIGVEQIARKLEKDPENATLLRRLGDLLRQLGRRDEAAQIFERLARVLPGDEAAERLANLLQARPAPAVSRGWPVGFSIRQQFLDPDELGLLQDFTRAHREQFEPTRVLQGGAASVLEQVRKSSSIRNVEPITSWFVPKIEARLAAIQRELGFRPLELRALDCKITRYGDGAFFAPHVDRGVGAEARVFGFIYYFWFPPQRFDGGGLAIYDWHPDTRARADTATNLLPNYNELVVLPADCWHEVLPVRARSQEFEAARFTLNGWLSALPDRSRFRASAPGPDE